jgi:hypothetical protein
LTLLTLLALLSFLTLLTFLAFLTFLTLLSGLLLRLRHLLLQLFKLTPQFLGLASQRFLLPAFLLGHVVAAVRLTRQPFLAACKFLQARYRFVHRILRLIECQRRFGLVLIALEIHFQLEQLAEIAAGHVAATATAALLHGYLDIGKDRLCTQQVLQCFLLDTAPRHRVRDWPGVRTPES